MSSCVLGALMLASLIPPSLAGTCPTNPDTASTSTASSSSSSLSSVADPDLVGFVPAPQVLPAGSLLIPMDQHYQVYSGTDGGSGTTPRFNFNCYGHVVKLLYANIPCKWIIASLKLQDQPDIVNAPVKQVLPTTGAATTVTLYSGPIAVHQQYASAALTLLTQYNSAFPSDSRNTVQVTVFQTTANITVSVRHELTNKPYVGISNAGG